MEAQAESESVRVKGEAEAYAIEAKARAEAEQMAKKADAWKEYQDAAIVDMLLEAMPQVGLWCVSLLGQSTLGLKTRLRCMSTGVLLESQ